MPETCPVHTGTLLEVDRSHDVPREFCPQCRAAQRGGHTWAGPGDDGTPPDVRGAREADRDG